LLRNCLLNHVTEGNLKGRIEVSGRQGKRRKIVLDELKGKVLEIGKGNTRSYSVENWLLKRLWISPMVMIRSK